MTTPTGPIEKRPALTASEARFLFIILLLGLMGLGIVTARRLGWWPGSDIVVTSMTAQHEPLDLNAAEWWELATLPDIGKVRAQAIVAARRERGGFESLDDLKTVKRIGPQLAEKLKPLLKLEEYKGEVGE